MAMSSKKLTFVFDSHSDSQYTTLLKGSAFRESPFAQYVVNSTAYRDCVQPILLDQLISDNDKSFGEFQILPIGVNMFFELSIQTMVLTRSDQGLALLKFFEKLKPIASLFVMLDMSWECATVSYINAIPAIARLLHFPVERFIYAGNNPVASRLSELPATYGYLAIGEWFFEIYTYLMHQFALESSDLEVNKSQNIPTKAFLSLNRRVRAHRVILGAFLLGNNYIQNSYFSFGGKEAASTDNDHIRGDAIDQARKFAHLTQITDPLSSAMSDLLANEPYEIDLPFATLVQDSPEFREVALKTSAAIESAYKDSFLSIVTETDFGGSARDFLLTEKTFKPILMRHPFVVVSGPGALFELRRLGYKTYDCVFPERYDEIFDPIERMIEVLRTITFIYEFIIRDPQGFLRATQEIAEFNRTHFIESVPNKARIFLKKLSDELIYMRRQGFRAALIQSNETGMEQRFSQCGSAVFDSGFHAYEVAFQGRWCSAAGVLTLWLTCGHWQLRMRIRETIPEALPVIYVDGFKADFSASVADGMSEISIVLSNVRSFVVIQFLSKHSFQPALVDPNSDSFRILSFWLDDRFKLSKI